MKKLTVFVLIQLLVITGHSQSFNEFIMKNDLTESNPGIAKRYTKIIGVRSETINNTSATVTITTSGTTDNLGCNPTASAIDAALGTATVSSDCNPVSITQSDGVVTISGCNYTQTRTWTASDACGGNATATRTVSWMVNETPPSFGISFTTNDVGCNPSASDIDGALGVATIASSGCGSVVLTVSTDPVQSSGCNRTQSRNWTATDDCGHFASAKRTISWVEDVVPPTIVTNGTGNNLGCNPTSSMINAALGTANITDNCGSFSYFQSDEPIISSGCSRSQTRRWTATDACGNSFVTGRTVTWIEDLNAPVIGPVSNINQSPDPGLFTAHVNIVAPTVTDDCGTGQLTGTRSDNLPLNDPYPLGQTYITWTASDACGNTAIMIQTVTIADTQAPIIISCPSLPLQCETESSNYTLAELAASDNWGIQSISYVISGATNREGNNNNASGLFNPGTSLIQWTVRDLAGNTSNCSTTIVIDKVDVVIPDAYPANITPLIGSPNTIYIGYGGTSITLLANVASSITPNSYSYKWTIGSPGGTNIGTGPTVTVSPTTSTIYYISIKDVNNCKPLHQVAQQINVTDIRCGTGKVWICEKQKNGSFKSVCISDAKVSDMPVGSYLGQCPLSITKTSSHEEIFGLNTDLNILALPNPSTGYFELRVQTTNTKEPVRIRAIDMTGRVIEIKQNIIAGQVLILGKEYKPGIFIIEALQGTRRATVKLVKIGS